MIWPLLYSQKDIMYSRHTQFINSPQVGPIIGLCYICQNSWANSTSVKLLQLNMDFFSLFLVWTNHTWWWKHTKDAWNAKHAPAMKEKTHTENTWELFLNERSHAQKTKPFKEQALEYSRTHKCFNSPAKSVVGSLNAFIVAAQPAL